MRLLKILTAAAALSLITVTAATAATLTAVYDAETKDVEISGDFSGVKQAVTIMILPSEVDRASLSPLDIINNKYITKQLLTDSEGDFSLTLTMTDSAKSNNYTVYAVCADEAIDAIFTHVSDDDMLEVLSDLNETDKSGIEELLKEKYIKIGLSLENSAYAADIAEILYNAKPSAGYTIDNFPKELGRATAFSLIKNGKSVQDTLREFQKAFDIDYSSDIETMEQAACDLLKSEITSKPAGDDTNKFFWQNLLYAKVKTASSYVEQGDYIVGYAAKAGLDIKDYNILSSGAKSDVLSELYKSQGSDYAGMAQSFEKLVKNAKASDKKGSSSGSGGGGSSGSGGSISFGSSNAAVSKPEPSYNGFYDVENHWGRMYIEALSSKGIISGFGDNSFRPEDNIKRAEYTKMIVDALKISKTFNTHFDDVTADKWYYPYVSAAKESGIVSGFDGKFNPEDIITREDAAMMLYKALEYKNAAFGEYKTFADTNDISEYAREAVSKLAGIGIVSGSESGFNPKGYAKRSEAAVMVSKLMDYNVQAVNSEELKEVDFYEEYELLNAISDIEKYIPHDMTGSVTRESFITALVNASGIKSIGGEVKFSDVSQGTELYEILKIAMANKLIPEGESFRPGEAITANEAAQMCVNMVGYGIKAEKSGGFPVGYRSTAQSIGIFDGVHTGTTLTASDAYKLIFNTLDTEFLEEAIVSGEVEYKTGVGTILSEYLDIEKTEGIVTANEYTETRSREGAAKSIKDLAGTVQIDGVSYMAKGDFNKLIGYNVTAYIRHNRDTDEYEAVCLVKEDNEEVTLISGELRYDEGYIYDKSSGRDKKYKISKSADIIVNGKADYDYSLDDVSKLSGNIVLIANDGGKEYNVIVVTSYRYMKINSYDKANLEIRDYNNPDNSIEMMEDGINSVYNMAEGREGTLGEIETGAYIAAAVSKDSEICSIMILSDALAGVVSSVSEDEIIIDSSSYLMSDYFIENDLRKLQAGRQTSFYVGVNGEIVAVSFEDSQIMYAYMIWAKRNEENETVRVKVFTQNDEIAIYECAEKIRLDGMSGVESFVIAQTMLQNPQLIRFSLNKDKKINVIDLQEVKNTYSDRDEHGLSDYNCLTRNRFAGGYYYRQRMFYPYFYIDNAIVFKIPKDIRREDDFAIGYSFVDGDVADGSFVEAYDVGFDGQAGAVIARVDTIDNASVALINANIVVVEKVQKTIDPDGDVRYAISGWKDGKFVKYYKDDNKVLKYSAEAEIKPGDIMRVSLRDETILSAVVDYVGSDGVMNTGANIAPSNCRSTACHYQIGQIYSLKNENAIISWKKISGNDYSKDISNMIGVKIPQYVLVFDSEYNKLRVADSNYLKSFLNSGNDASKIVVQQDYGVSQFCVVYE